MKKNRPFIYLFIVKTIRYCLYQLSRVFIRDKSKWIFGANGWYGNSKYLFIETVKNHKEINAIWISHDKRIVKYLTSKGYKSYYWLSLLGLYHSATAKVYISNITIREINSVLAGGTFYFDLWHGIPMKACLWKEKIHKYENYVITDENKNTFVSKIMAFVELYRKPDLILSPSPFETEHAFMDMFDVGKDKCIEANYPQNKLFHLEEHKMEEYISIHEEDYTKDLIKKIKSFSKTYIYMPTFRDNENDFIKTSKIDFEKLDLVLQKNNQLFIVKLHPKTNINMNFDSFLNIIKIENNVDVYVLFPYIKCLITDYSSVYYDYLQTSGDIILFDFDRDSYLSSCRDFIFNYDKMMPARRAHTFEFLLDIIERKEVCQVPNKDEIISLIWGKCDNDIDLIEEVKYLLSN